MSKNMLREALRIALRNNTPETHENWGRFHHFSFIIQGNQIVEWGINRNGDPWIRGSNHVSKIHSEHDAFKKARGIMDLRKPFDVINIRLSKHNELRISKPCPCCHSFLKTMGCRNVYFTTEVGWAKIGL